ncbi:protein quaking-B isoform X2 [Hemitrygon akajei]|uniref:protein quaking-B isoform X2 n=1 Tax=Hemitrygon akajei TaxID=2704970 RepID=UPI003BFA2D50
MFWGGGEVRWNMVGEMENKERPKPTPDYLMQLMNDKKLMSSLPNFCGIFNHLERLLDEEISRVRKDMYNDTLNGSTEKRSAELPDGVGPIVQLQEKLYVPVKEYPDFNFVGRILGPRGLTAKQLEAETGCKIMVRGKGSMRDKKKEEQNRGKPNWEHLNEDLHVLITVEDAQNRAEIKLKRAVEEVKKLLVPAAEGEDNLKKMQLMELAILNGTYRDANIKSPTAQAPRIITGPTSVLPPAALRAPTPAGPTIMPLIRQIQTATVMPNGSPHPTAIVPPAPEAGLIYTPYDYPYTLAPATSILEYPIEPSGVLVQYFEQTRGNLQMLEIQTTHTKCWWNTAGQAASIRRSTVDVSGQDPSSGLTERKDSKRFESSGGRGKCEMIREDQRGWDFETVFQ